MSLIDKIKKKPKPIPKKESTKLPKNSLDKQELSIILNLIKETSFKGEDIETMYTLILKLQDQYFNRWRRNSK